MRYQTEIHVSDDRYVCLQLPTFFPEGKAVVTVTIVNEDGASSNLSADDSDRQDIEWWDEFDDEEAGRRP